MPTTGNNNHILFTPKRNNYFYGKLLDVDQLTNEQRYFNQKRWLLNRLVVGNGVVCGLDVVEAGENNDGMVLIQPGIAIDGFGHEIIVPKAISINPRQLTDDQGNPVGDPIEGGTVEICLVYAEKLVDPVPVLVPECETPGNCANSTIQEGFFVLIRRSDADPDPSPSCTLVGFPLPVNGTLHRILCEQVTAGCPETVDDPCVSLARINLDLDSDRIEVCSGRQLVYSNDLLYQLILCLAERVAVLAGDIILRYVTGDGQSGQASQPLSGSLVVKVVDRQGQPVKDVSVNFEVSGGNGTVTPNTLKTNNQGLAEASWTLGTNPVIQQVTASAGGTPFTIEFRATIA